jgi:uncharacterized membrane protein
MARRNRDRQQPEKRSSSQGEQSGAVPAESAVPDPTADVPPDVLEGMRRAVREGNETELLALVSHHSYSGPIPAPEVLQRYDHIVPGAADRIMRWTESQTRHRHELEREQSEAEIRQRDRGQHYALIIAIAALIASVSCAWLGLPWVSGVIAVSAFGAIGTASILSLVWKK